MPGFKCVVVHNGDYHRATMLSKTESEISAKLVDIGTDAACEMGNIYELKSEMHKYPQLAFQCAIADVKPVDSEVWDEKIGQVFEEILLDLNGADKLPVFAKATFVCVESDKVFVELNIDRTDIADTLVTKELAVVEHELDNSIAMSGKKILPDMIEEFGDYKLVILDTDCDYEVVMTDFDDMDKLVFQTKEGIKTTEEIGKSIADHVADRTGGEGVNEEFVKGPCLAKCTVDGQWYRANLVSVLPEGQDTEKRYEVGDCQ